jgi:dihydroxyacetone kinase
MTRLYDDPALFADDMLAGFVDAYARYVVPVEGGVVRCTETPQGKVAVVIGGGAGHYPAFCGLVGPGLADGAVVGNVFTSPSAQQAYSVARAAEARGGVLFCFGNYAGDVINFGQAQDHLRAEGIEVRTVLVTDDIASASPQNHVKRRGIAGDLVVFKIAGAAAEEGCDLEEVFRLASKANARTRTLGLAFAGCTLPGAAEPLFGLPAGNVGVGLGIHGEPGISEIELSGARELAQLLVGRVVEEGPDPSEPRVAVLLNGLGATKYEELFVLWKTTAALLDAAGLVVVEPEVGELVTSLDMAGCSLTVSWLDDELEPLWRAGADTPAFRKLHGVHRRPPEGPRRQTVIRQEEPSVRSSRGRSLPPRAGMVVGALEAVSAAMLEAEDELGKLDAVAGDGDHGRGMVRGSAAAASAARESAATGNGVGDVLRAAGDAWAARAGGTSGALWGAGLRAAGDRLVDCQDQPGVVDVVEAVRSALVAVQTLGGAQLGDKTLVDALTPFCRTLASEVESGVSLREAWRAASDVATVASLQTAQLSPKLGRAVPLAQRSLGSPDPGAVSLALCMAVAVKWWDAAPSERQVVGDQDGDEGNGHG